MTFVMVWCVLCDIYCVYGYRLERPNGVQEATVWITWFRILSS